MKLKLTSILALGIGLVAFSSCDTEVEKLEIQKLKTYDEQYYANIRAYKQSDHEVSFAYYVPYLQIIRQTRRYYSRRPISGHHCRWRYTCRRYCQFR